MNQLNLQHQFGLPQLPLNCWAGGPHVWGVGSTINNRTLAGPPWATTFGQFTVGLGSHKGLICLAAFSPLLPPCHIKHLHAQWTGPAPVGQPLAHPMEQGGTRRVN